MPKPLPWLQGSGQQKRCAKNGLNPHFHSQIVYARWQDDIVQWSFLRQKKKNEIFYRTAFWRRQSDHWQRPRPPPPRTFNVNRINSTFNPQLRVARREQDLKIVLSTEDWYARLVRSDIWKIRYRSEYFSKQFFSTLCRRNTLVVVFTGLKERATQQRRRFLSQRLSLRCGGYLGGHWIVMRVHFFVF